MKKTIRRIVLAASLAGCSPAYVPPPLGPEHPASARAPETPPPPRSDALAGDALFRPEPSRRSEANGHVGGGHEMHGGH